MQLRLQHLIFAALVISLVSLAYGLNYMYFSDIETTRFGDRIKFWHGDTLCDPIRSNDRIAIMQDPYFCDFVISSAPDFWRGSGYNPQFALDYPPVFNAPRLELPPTADWLRTQAIGQGHYFNQGDTMRAKVHLEGDSMRIWWAQRNGSIDTTTFSFHTLSDSAVVFFDTPIVDLWGTVSTTLIFGVGGRAGLPDNLLYASSNQTTGAPSPNHTEKFALVSEGEIKVLNTWANGRENSHGHGLGWTGLDSASILLNGLYCALGTPDGSFTFDQQNDPDSGYVYRVNGQPHIDDRGTIYLWGGTTQRQHGYVHRSNNGSTGYLKQYRSDNELRYWHIGVFNVRENVIEPSAVNFGNVMVGDTARDTVMVINDYVPVRVDSVAFLPQFFAGQLRDTFMWTYPVPVAFAPQQTGIFDDSLRLYSAYYQQWFAVAVSGVGVAAATDPLHIQPFAYSLSCYPNPFNPVTRIAFTIPKADNVELVVYDLSGRLVRALASEWMEAGEHAVAFDGAVLPSGLYFVRLQSAHRALTQKLVLLK